MALQATYLLFFINHICLQCTPRAQETAQRDGSEVRSKYQHERAQIKDRQLSGSGKKKPKEKTSCIVGSKFIHVGGRAALHSSAHSEQPLQHTAYICQ